MTYYSKSEPRITILMAIYNCVNTLEEALDSLLSQTYQGFKVIMCDDASTDNTLEIANKYVKRYPEKFILIRNEQNLKLPSSLNRCLEHANTEYIARMDGDDISKPDRFEKEIEFLDRNKEYGWVSCPMEYFNENGIYRVGKVKNQTPDKFSFLKGTPFCHAPMMMRTNVLKSVNGYTVEKWTQRGQDVYLWAKLFNAGYKGYNLDEPLYMMRDDEKALKRRTFRSRFHDMRRIYEVHKLLKMPFKYRYQLFEPLLKAFAPSFVYKFFHYRRK